MLLLRKKHESHKSKILKQLRKSPYGSWTHELVKPSVGGHRLSSYIKQLRKDGYDIRVQRINQFESKYFLVGEE